MNQKQLINENDELRKRIVILEEANKNLESINYNLSHDIRAQLRSIDGFSHILEEECSQFFNEKCKDYLKRIRHAVCRLNDMLSSILNFMRLSKDTVYKEEIDMSEIILVYMNNHHQCYPNEQVETLIQPDVTIYGDKTMIHIAIENLLNNAIKYTSKVEHPKIEFGTKKINDETVYYIKDNGIGFQGKDSEKIFLPFIRLHSQKEYEGVGIGLTSIKQIISSHGGKIWAESELNKGATFYFTLGHK